MQFITIKTGSPDIIVLDMNYGIIVLLYAMNICAGTLYIIDISVARLAMEKHSYVISCKIPKFLPEGNFYRLDLVTFDNCLVTLTLSV